MIRNVTCDENICTIENMASEYSEAKSGLLKDNLDLVVPLRRVRRHKIKAKPDKRKLLKGVRRKRRHTLKKILIGGGRRRRVKRSSKPKSVKKRRTKKK